MAELRRIAVVGTGSFGERRARSFRGRGLEVAFVSRERERACAATARVGGDPARGTDRLEDALAWSDGVFVATPPSLHAPAVLAAARAGRPVLVEKPLCESFARARALRDELGDARPLVTVAENYRFLPALPALLRARDAIAPLERVEVIAWRERPPTDWRMDPALAGGGVLMDIGVHFVHLLRCLVGPLEVGTARRRGDAADTGLDLEARAGAASVWLSLDWRAPRRRSSFLLVGARGRVRHRVGKRWIFRTGASGLPRLPVFAGLADSMGQDAVVTDWLASAARGEPGGCDLDEGLADLEVVAAAYEKAATAAR